MGTKVQAASALGSKQESRNQVLFREVNDRVCEVVALPLAAGEEVDFLCECGDEACIETVRLDLKEYEAVRSTHRFVMVPGHEDGFGDATVHGSGRFVVVERRASR